MCECGAPKFECRNEANRGLYEVADVTCYKQAAIEEHTGQDKFKPDPGQRFYAVEIDDELITRRTFTPLTEADNRRDETGKSDGSREAT